MKESLGCWSWGKSFLQVFGYKYSSDVEGMPNGRFYSGSFG